MAEGPEAGLCSLVELQIEGELENYFLFHSAKADFYRRLGRTIEAREAYQRALVLTYCS